MSNLSPPIADLKTLGRLFNSEGLDRAFKFLNVGFAYLDQIQIFIINSYSKLPSIVKFKIDFIAFTTILLSLYWFCIFALLL